MSDEERVEGLSPRTRGNPRLGLAHPARQRSIPANAGEPASTCRTRRTTRVYPRERGGTRCCDGRKRGLAGLSPRTRGNQQTSNSFHVRSGSIPANAGEPRSSRRSPPPRGVYPRERGGTAHRASRQRCASGLSPRTRGNRAVGATRRASRGSIPANAGEPPFQLPVDVQEGVYPRERGGTTTLPVVIVAIYGLSPRTRGNLTPPTSRGVLTRSIPANAGEPTLASNTGC